MLLELQEVARSLELHGIRPEPQHQWMKPLPKGEFIWVQLGPNGVIERVEGRPASEFEGVQQVQKDNHNKLPLLKVASPLFEFEADDMKLALEGLPEGASRALLNLFESRINAANLRAKVAKEFASDYSKARRFAESLLPLLSAGNGFTANLERMLRFLGSAQDDSRAFLLSIAKAALGGITNGNGGDASVLVRFLAGKLNRRKDGFEKNPAQYLFLDCNPQRGELPVSHGKLWRELNHVLLVQTAHPGSGDALCSMSGQPDRLLSGSFPRPNLPVLGLTYLMSMNKDAPCHQRYGRISSEIFPIGEGTAQKLSDSILWITEGQRRRKTWKPVPSEGWVTVGGKKVEQQDLLLCYLDGNPASDEAFAELFSGDDDESASAYETLTGDLVERLEDLEKVRGSNRIRTIILRKISKGQVQVQNAQQYQLKDVRSGLERWTAACKNAIDYSLKIQPTKKGERALDVQPGVLKPVEFVRVSKKEWRRHGAEEAKVSGLRLSQVHDLMYGPDNSVEREASHILSLLVPRCELLLRRRAEIDNLMRETGDEMPASDRWDAIRSISVLSVLLFLTARKKECFMNDPAFLLGQLLGLSDQLHKHYCTSVRNDPKEKTKYYPPQFVGAATYGIVAQRPTRGLSLLSERLRVYLSWAHTRPVGAASEEAEDKSSWPISGARSVLKKYSAVAEELAGRLPDRALNDAEKAEMLLGYLASHQRGKQEKSNSNQENQK